MENRKGASLSVVLAIVYSLLFHKTPIGINLLLFELSVVFLHWHFNRDYFQHFLPRYLSGLTLLSAVFTVIHPSAFVRTMNTISFIVLIGAFLQPRLKSSLTAAAASLLHVYSAQIKFAKNLFISPTKKNRFGKWLWQIRLFILPLLIALLFLTLYRYSNPVYEVWVSDIGKQFDKAFHWLVDYFDFPLFWTFIGGLLISNFSLMRSKPSFLFKMDDEADDTLQRKKSVRRKYGLNTSLRNEYKSGLFLFGLLNVLLFLLLIVEIDTVWLHFTWKGSTLKEFVHQGTYLLILSILISILLVVYFFRGNLNFFSRNIWLKRLCSFWILQNAILVLSVLIRNLWYVHYFALAHLRIGLFMFLALTFVGLFLVYLKVNKGKSMFYLLRIHFLVSLSFITACSFVDWDKVIVRYNLAHADEAYFHFDFLDNLSSSTLPLLYLPLERFEEIEHHQTAVFLDERSRHTASTFKTQIDSRAIEFIHDWSERPLLSWNWRDYRTHSLLVKKMREANVSHSSINSQIGAKP